MQRKTLLVLMLLLGLLGAAADTFSPNRALYTISTRFFHIIFPEECRSSAAYLATFADDTYDEVGALLGTEKRHRITVVMSPDSEDINGSFTTVPYLQIFLGVGTIESGSVLGSFNDMLRKLFLHELTHAVSITLTNPFFGALVAIFGTPLYPAMFTSPLYMVEGVTVSFESRDGHGRATDPLAGAVLRQDIVEARWKSPTQASGAWDAYPGGQVFYHYGGWFSRMLQERYGMEKYARLWKRLGDGAGVAFALVFRDVYGIGLEEAWEELRSWMTIPVPVLVDGATLIPHGYYTALEAGPDGLYYADAGSRSIVRFDPASGAKREICSLQGVRRISVDAEGSLLVSASADKDGLTRLALYEQKDGALRKLPHEGLREAAWLAGGSFAAIRVNGFRSDLVCVGVGGERVLLRGSEKLTLSQPVSSEDGQSVFVLASEGSDPFVLRVPVDGGALSRLVLPEGLPWLRYLSREGSTLRLGWDDDKLYRLVEVDLASGSASWQTVPLSGGVHAPVGYRGRTYALGKFSDGVALRVLASDRTAYGMRRGAVGWEDASAYASLASVYDAKPDAASLPERRYNPLPWLLPRFWYPAASLTGADYLVGAGFVSQDPVGVFALDAVAYWAFAAGLPCWSVSASSSDLPFGLAAQAKDYFTYWIDSVTSGAGVDRTSFASLSLGDTAETGRGTAFSWSLAGELSGGTSLAASPDFATAYRLWDSQSAWASASVSIEDFDWTPGLPGDQRGFSLSVVSRNAYAIRPVAAMPFSAGVEASLLARWRALRLSLDGAYGLYGSMTYASGGVSVADPALSAARRPALYPELGGLKGRGTPGTLYAQGEASLRLLHAPIQAPMFSLYAHRIALDGGARAAWSGEFLWSAFGRVSLSWGAPIGAAALARLVSQAEVCYTPGEHPWSAGFVLTGKF